MKENKIGNPAGEAAARPKRLAKRRQPAATARRRGEPDLPDFLVRLTGKARAKALSKDLASYPHHD